MQPDCNDAVTLQLVVPSVNPRSHSRRDAQIRATEVRILAAARELFVTRGWSGTTLTDVAAAADVAERTVYVRFGTKAAVLQRVIQIAVAGDHEPTAVRDREWYQTALTAATLEERIDAFAAGGAALMSRAAPVIAVALQAIGDDPALGEAARAGHAASREDIRRVWRKAHADGLFPAGIDLAWFLDTVAVIGQADVYLLGGEVVGWTPRRYEKWLRSTLRQLLRLPSVTKRT